MKPICQKDKIVILRSHFTLTLIIGLLILVLSTGIVQAQTIEFVGRTTVAEGGKGFTSLVIGPDNKLYGLSSNGYIKRWNIDPKTGLLSNQQIISTIRNAAGGISRLAIGMAFDPAATANNLILWVSHTKYGFYNQPDFEGKISRLSGANLQNIQDYVTHLPRSDNHAVTNSIEFGPDGALYVLQGANTRMGAPNNGSQRHEVLLSGALLRLDLALIKSNNLALPINAKTEQGGSYNPYKTEAPLTLYATGLRNAYDMVFHSNGQLYVPNNGPGGPESAPGSDPSSTDYKPPQYTTYSGPVVPYVSGIPYQNDYVYRVVKGGYYGQPNPRRAQYVLLGGNPTTSSWPEAVVSQYPVGTKPDANYKGYSKNLERNKSPNGIIEYKSSSFNGALAGKLINAWFTPNKLVVMDLGASAPHNITKVIEGIAGFSNFSNPLDLVEDKRNGNLYISEYQYSNTNLGGTGKITLLKPAVPPVQTNTAVWLEAECSEAIGSNWKKVSDGGASGGAYLTVKSGYNRHSSAPTNASDRITFSFTVPQPGSYHIAARIKSPTYADNSFWVRVDKGSWLLWNTPLTDSSFNWEKVLNSPFSFNAGAHTIDIAYREDGTQLDKMYISSSSTLPIGFGHTASNCGTTSKVADRTAKSATVEEPDLLRILAGDVVVYPNPSTRLFEVYLDQSLWKGKGRIIVKALQGNVVKELQYTEGLPQHIQLDLSLQQAGVYILQIESEQKAVIKKLIKEK